MIVELGHKRAYRVILFLILDQKSLHLIQIQLHSIPLQTLILRIRDPHLPLRLQILQLRLRPTQKPHSFPYGPSLPRIHTKPLMYQRRSVGTLVCEIFTEFWDDFPIPVEFTSGGFSEASSGGI